MIDFLSLSAGNVMKVCLRQTLELGVWDFNLGQGSVW